MFGRSLQQYLIIIPAVLIAIIVHEVSHGFAAYLLGDSTAKENGRLNFNPINHIDPIGLLCMILVGFGWAKPVPVNLANLKNRKWGMSIVAIAGPLSNFVLSFVCIFIVGLGYGTGFLYQNEILMSLANFLMVLASLSAGLGVFNLLSVPPLDGSNIIFPFLSHKARAFMYNNGQYIQFGVLALLMFGFFDNVLFAMRSLVLNGILDFTNILLPLFLK